MAQHVPSTDIIIISTRLHTRGVGSLHPSCSTVVCEGVWLQCGINME